MALEQKASQGKAQAQYELGTIYLNSKNYIKVLEWFMKAAKQNHADAQFIIGAMYYSG
ncbi:hypothetical protein [Commensalibacter papalotli (ex Botero et al. 2024)]|uniref:hypothetical protein n=1 Tax=Commensalibacter papalotli (ex Botero et al. 2024) TaxID=2972766 RepID=UPI0024910D75|nr:hypothetical protein [Commensalibacter papalotli (ex Botero et al. 2024)]